jgi:hypothetical protein
MFRILLIFLFAPFGGNTQIKKLLLEDYSFPSSDGSIGKMRQSNDTLYVLSYNGDRPAYQKPASRYKIIAEMHLSDFSVWKLEQLDSVVLSKDPFPDARFSVLALKNFNNKKLTYTPLAFELTRTQVDSFDIDVKSMNSPFYFTFFSDTYVTELGLLKTLSVIKDAELIKDKAIQLIKSEFEKNAENPMFKKYGFALGDEFLNRIYIQSGFNPFGAGKRMEKLLRNDAMQ